MSAAAVMALLVLAGCQSNQPAPPAGRPVVGLTMRDYRFDLDRPLPRGQVAFKIVNAGAVNHRMVVIPLAEDMPPIDVQLRSADRRVVNPVAGIPDRPPGGNATFAVYLPAGRYALVCFARTSDGETHALKGMAMEFRIE